MLQLAKLAKQARFTDHMVSGGSRARLGEFLPKLLDQVYRVELEEELLAGRG